MAGWRTMLGLWGFGVLGMARTDAPGVVIRHEPIGWGSWAELSTRMGSEGILFAPGLRSGPPAEGLPWAEGYRFDPETGSLEAIPKETWDRAPGPVVECESTGFPPKVLVLDGRLKVDGRFVDLPAEARQAALDPSGRRIAVLIGRGFRYRARSIAPGFGGPRLLGFREHVFVRRDSGAIIDGRRRIRFGTEDPQICWTPDGRYAVLYTGTFTEVTFVKAPPGGDVE